MTDTTRLDKLADGIASARATGQFAELEQQETAFVEFVLDIAPDLDRQTVGAAWLILGQLLATGLTQHPAHEQLQAVGGLLNAARLAGQRMYAGAPLSLPCPIPRSNGTACRFTAKAARQEVIDAMMRAHVDVYHPSESWPQVEADEPEGLVHLPQLNAFGVPSDYALCDTGDGASPGGTLANNSGHANCEKCLNWSDSPDGGDA